MQTLSKREDVDVSGEEQEPPAERALPTALFLERDRQTFRQFLRIGIADVLARGETIDLDINEEFPRLIPVLCSYFTGEELTQLIGREMAARFFALYRLEIVQNLFLESELQKVLHAFNEAGIAVILMKGPVLAHAFYPRPQLRTYHDFDMLIHPQDLSCAHDLLLALGYKFYEEFRANVINEKRTGYNYMLKRDDSWLEVLIELHTAPHADEDATVFDVQSWWAQAMPITVLGEKTLALSAEDHLLYLCWHYRFHSFTRLLWLYDLAMLARACAHTLDWETLLRQAKQFRLKTTLYYCLSWCRDLFAVEIPAQVFDCLRPPSLCRFVVERIALSNLVTTLATVEGKNRRIVAHRAMVDSTAGLLYAGLRTLFPSPAAMGQRYMEHSRLPLRLFFVYYLIHPWLTLAKARHYVLPFSRKERKSGQ
ncbi:MAG TPA: nucleotidyltransferase family protein [Ktedonobacteraceae bacterium]|nr:nucleotidyltransferase family protein [Ktedonobacteraceae bacterium]